MAKTKSSLSEVISNSLNSKTFDLSSFKKSKFLDQTVKFKEQKWIPFSSALQDALNVAYTAAKELNDQKLLDQIGNTITFFTRTHVVDAGSQGKKATEPVTEMRRFQKLAGIKK